MASVRELIATLGFKVDTGPATRFDAAVNRSKSSLESLTQVRLGRFGSRLKTMFGVAIAGVAGIGAASLGAFKKFSDVAKGLKQLEFQFKGKFKPLKAEIDSILADKTLGKLTRELELVNTAAAAFELGLDPDVFIRTLRPALEFAIVNRKSVAEITSAIAAFIGEADLDLLIKLGVLNQRQIELLKVTKTGPGQAGIIARTARIEEIFAGIQPEIQKQLRELVESGVLSLDQLTNTFNETAKELGEKTLPAIKAITTEAISLLDEFRGRIKQEGVVEAAAKVIGSKIPELFEFLPEAGGIDPKDIKVSKEPAVGKFFKKLIQFAFPGLAGANQAIQKINRQQRQQRIPSISGFTKNIISAAPAGAGQPVQVININNNITVQSGATADPAAIERGVNEAIRRNMGTAAEQSRSTTIRRGG